jgi:hypothetical protein
VCDGHPDEVAKAIRLYYAVRDGISYTPYCDFRSPETYRASACLSRGSGFCVAKAALLAATARVAGIPAGRVRRREEPPLHPAAARFMGTDVFYYHGYAGSTSGDVGQATPAFDLGLCERFGVRPLEFDRLADSLFHPFDRSGRRHLEYLRDRGRTPTSRGGHRRDLRAPPGLASSGAESPDPVPEEAGQPPVSGPADRRPPYAGSASRPYGVVGRQPAAAAPCRRRRRPRPGDGARAASSAPARAVGPRWPAPPAAGGARARTWPSSASVIAPEGSPRPPDTPQTGHQPGRAGAAGTRDFSALARCPC